MFSERSEGDLEPSPVEVKEAEDQVRIIVHICTRILIQEQVVNQMDENSFLCLIKSVDDSLLCVQPIRDERERLLLLQPNSDNLEETNIINNEEVENFADIVYYNKSDNDLKVIASQQESVLYEEKAATNRDDKKSISMMWLAASKLAYLSSIWYRQAGQAYECKKYSKGRAWRYAAEHFQEAATTIASLANMSPIFFSISPLFILIYKCNLHEKR